MSISITKHAGQVVAEILDQLTIGNRENLKRAVFDELERGERRFLIDFRRTGYIDSSGLGALVSIARRVRERHGALELANLSDDLRTLFELTRLQTLFDITDEDGGQSGRPAPLRPRSPGPLSDAAAEPRPEPDGRRE